MEKRKHIWAMLLFVVSCLFSTNAFAYDALINGIYYNFDGNEATVTYKNISDYSYSGNIVIPSFITFNGKAYNVTRIGDYAFSFCSGLTSITIGNSVTNIGEWAFGYCSGLKSITIGNSVTNIGKFAFENCTGLKAIIIPNSVRSIENCAFEGCSGFTSVTIPNSVTSIGSSSFSGCSGLTSVTIGNSVTSIGACAFSGCTKLNKVIVPNIEAWYNITFEDYTANPLYYAHHLYSDETTEITNLTIPGYVTSIGNYVFNSYSGLTSITIPNSIKSIGNSAFDGCSGLTSVDIPNSVTSIGEYAFCGCSGLTSIAIPNSVTSIGNSAFKGCTGLTSITIPNSITTIEHNTFRDCTSLVSIAIPNSVTSMRNRIFENCIKLKAITIPNSLTSIGSYTFAGCTELSEITIPNSVTTIGNYAFKDCSGLVSVTIGSGVQSIGSYAFEGVYPHKVIWIAKNQPNIDSYSELNGNINYVPNNSYSGLDNVVVYPYLSSMFEVDGVKYVPVNPAERTCDAIDCAYNELAKNITIGETVTYKDVMFTVKKVNPYICYKNSSIKSMKLNFKGYIEKNAFEVCTNLMDVTIGDGVTSIGDMAFSGCSSLDYLHFGKSVATIGKEAFSGCTAMTELISSATTPPTCGTDALNDIDKWVCMLKVPEGYVTAYQTASQWCDFFFVDAFDPDGINGIEADPSLVGEVECFDLQGRRIDKAQKGINIIRNANGTTKKVLIKR